ncbi:hypothetical protein V5799_013840 [Amblyomma americanum]|uniref:Uncharacterized protein n=1 Tax=Amblyomma americanum TaxID=6943 RepID=A0AAQ4E4W9_AMBAM
MHNAQGSHLRSSGPIGLDQVQIVDVVVEEVSGGAPLDVLGQRPAVVATCTENQKNQWCDDIHSQPAWADWPETLGTLLML